MSEHDPPGPGDDPPTPPPRRSKWRPVIPVPAYAPPPDFKHYHYKQAEASYEYRLGDVLYGYTARFRSSDGEAFMLPYTWCVDESDERGTQRWHQKQWDAPRPLYVPSSILSLDGRLPVVVVSDEACALAGHELLGHEFDFVSWDGERQWGSAEWSWLSGRAVYLWPRVDSKRPKQAAANTASAALALAPPYPAAMQPGMKAMVGIGSLLMADQGCKVYLCPVPAPGQFGEVWDLVAALQEGAYDALAVRGFIRASHVFVPPDEATRAKAAIDGQPHLDAAGNVATQPGAAASPGFQAWRDALLVSMPSGAVKAVRENVVLALDGIPSRQVMGVPEAHGVFAYNEFTSDVVLTREAPWGSEQGPCAEVEDLLVGEWLVREHRLPSMARSTLEEGVRLAAHKRRFHPVRDQVLGYKWDKKKRLSTWLRNLCLEKPAEGWDNADPLQQYMARVGTFFLMGMVARVLPVHKVRDVVVRGPGTKFDYMLILEGKTGLRKSTMLKILASDQHFADTGMVMGDKDSYQNLQGVWLYEFPELDQFSKSDVKKIKAYVASATDYYRASFDRRPRKHPRQVVFAGSTNDDHYLTDPTGNRRFWPVPVTRRVDTDWLQANREQLFAEAVVRVMAGERMYPTPEEEKSLFVPQQQLRMAENSVASAIADYLYPRGNASGPNSDGVLCDEISIHALLIKIGLGLDKRPGGAPEKAAGAALRDLGWSISGRDNEVPGRPRLYRRPKAMASAASSSRPTSGDSPAGADDDCPF